MLSSTLSIISIFKKLFFLKRKDVIIDNGHNTDNLTKLIELTNNLTNFEENRKKIIEEFTAIRNAFNSLALLFSDWVWITDEEGKYTYASPKSGKIYGIPPEEVIGKKPHEFVLENNKQKIIDFENYILRTHEKVMDYEVETEDGYGNIIRLVINAVPIFDSKGKYKGHLGTESCVEHIKDVSKTELLEKFNNDSICNEELLELKKIVNTEMKVTNKNRLVYSWIIRKIDKTLNERNS